MIRLGNFNVVLDSCVLYDSLIRDLLLCIAEKELYRPVWSNEICNEVERNLIKKIGSEKANNLIKTINQAFPEAMDLNNSENIDLKNTNIAPKDRHVVCTAICSNSQVILTYNMQDFPQGDLKQFSIEVQTPDEFLINILNLSYKRVLNIYEEMESLYANPPIPREILLQWLKQKVPKFTGMIIPYLDGSITRIY